MTLFRNLPIMNIAMHRFFVPRDAIAFDEVTITGELVHRIGHVLRLRPGNHIVVLDNSGYEYELELTAIGTLRVTAKVVERRPGKGEPNVNIQLCQALIKADKFELVLQKGVELGVREFCPFTSERCVPERPSEVRFERWRAIIREAAEQSRRAVLPILRPVQEFAALCVQSGEPGIVLWEEERSRGISQVLKSLPFKDTGIVRVFVGPEGGFMSSEIDLARQHNIEPVSMGRRILRTETAGLVALSAIMYERGELG